MRIKLDENLSRHLKPPLESLGHDVATTGEEGLLGKTDAEVAVAVIEERRMLFTLDLEFADLRKYPPGNHAGVILFRPRTTGPLAVNDFVLRFVNEAEIDKLSKCVVVVDPDRVRVRPPSPGRSHD